MSVSDILPIDPSYAVPQEVLQSVLTTPFDSGQEQRKLKWANPKRRFRIEARSLNETELASIRDFYLARQGAFDVFSFLPPVNHDRLIKAIPCGTGDGIMTQFTIGNSSTPPYYYRVYTGAGNRNKAYEDGVENTNVTFANDDANKLSTVTFTTAPLSGKVITVDIDRYLIVRFNEGPFRAALVAFGIGDADFELLEVFRDSI